MVAQPARRSRRALRDAVEGYLYILPWIIGFAAFTLGPMLASLYLSFHSYSVLGSPRFIGLENYANALTAKDPLFWTSWARTWSYALMFIPAGLTISLILAAMLNQQLKGSTVYRTLFFIPTLVPVVASALLWRWMLHPELGLINYLLWELRIPGPRWLADPGTALMALVGISLWASVGGSRMIIFLAGLQGVPEELYDAAWCSASSARCASSRSRSSRPKVARPTRPGSTCCTSTTTLSATS
jgi:multiple sugar transport system permease protein